MSKYSTFALALAIGSMACAPEGDQFTPEQLEQAQAGGQRMIPMVNSFKGLATHLEGDAVYGTVLQGQGAFERFTTDQLETSQEYLTDSENRLRTLPDIFFEGEEYDKAAFYQGGKTFFRVAYDDKLKADDSDQHHEFGHAARPILSKHKEKILEERAKNDNTQTVCEAYGELAKEEKDPVVLQDCLVQPYIFANGKSPYTNMLRTNDYIVREEGEKTSKEICEILEGDFPGTYTTWKQDLEENLPDSTYPKTLTNWGITREVYAKEFQKNKKLYKVEREFFDDILGDLAMKNKCSWY